MRRHRRDCLRGPAPLPQRSAQGRRRRAVRQEGAEHAQRAQGLERENGKVASGLTGKPTPPSTEDANRVAAGFGFVCAAHGESRATHEGLRTKGCARRTATCRGVQRSCQTAACSMTSTKRRAAAIARRWRALCRASQTHSSPGIQQLSPRHPQVRQREQRNDLRRVLRQPSVAHLGQAELLLDHPEPAGVVDKDLRGRRAGAQEVVTLKAPVAAIARNTGQSSRAASPPNRRGS